MREKDGGRGWEPKGAGRHGERLTLKWRVRKTSRKQSCEVQREVSDLDPNYERKVLDQRVTLMRCRSKALRTKGKGKETNEVQNLN